MADQTERIQRPKPKPDILQGPRLNYNIPNLINLSRLSTPQSTASRAVGVLLCYAAYLRYFSNIKMPNAPSSSFTLPPITPPEQDLDVNSEIFSKKFLVELYLAVLVLVLYLWPFWQAYKKGTTFSSFVLSCFSTWGVSLVIYLGFLKLVQHYGAS
ncbi:hypothetical protein F4782DRAFT_527391 [Xylaria castorea]|nr:hypothetical protein F4782DRAFT_527391 [Xylaria castorea]